MTGARYDRYGLTGNPFRDLTSEGLSDVEFSHVNLGFDEALRTIKEEVFDKENRAFVVVTGGHGAGKTERLLLAAAEGKARKALVAYVDIPAKAGDTLHAIADAIARASGFGGFAKVFTAPAWFRGISSVAGSKDAAADPVATGKAIGAALNGGAPALLLLNDLHNLVAAADADRVARALQEAADALRPGTLVMFGSYPNYLEWITKRSPALASRINRTFVIPTLNPTEAGLLLAKKLLAKRIVEELDPLYPFDRASVAALTEAARGNPRRLLEIADLALEYGIERRLYRVDADAVKAVLARVPSASSATGVGTDAPPTMAAARSVGVGPAVTKPRLGTSATAFPKPSTDRDGT
jgi:type II secretory pathway predicted ATPase ExeA